MTDTTIHRVGRLRGDKVQYRNGIGFCIWEPYPGYEDCGPCLDFSLDDIDDLIELLQKIKVAEPDIYTED